MSCVSWRGASDAVPARLPIRTVLVVAISGVLTACNATSQAADCDRVAAPSGSDAASGKPEAPLRTPQRLADGLQPGQTGCLRAGTYPGKGPTGRVVRFAHGGRAGAPIAIRSFPGERARLAGVIYVPEGSDDITISDLDVIDPTPFERTRQISVQVDARRTVLDRLEITNGSRKTCVELGGFDGFGAAIDSVIRDSVLYDCGDPANDLLDHAIYVANARRARITGNLIRGTSGYAIHLYPAAQATIVDRNVMLDGGGGVIFAGDDHDVSSDNLVEGNLIAGSSLDFNIAAYWQRSIGSGNVARANCLIDGAGGNVEPEWGFSAQGNATVDPLLAPAYRRGRPPGASEPCSGLLRAISAFGPTRDGAPQPWR